MKKNKDIVEEHISWKINYGNSSFWWDDWVGEDALAKYTNVSSLNNDTISHINGTWNDTMLRQQVHPMLIPQILQTTI